MLFLSIPNYVNTKDISNGSLIVQVVWKSNFRQWMSVSLKYFSDKDFINEQVYLLAWSINLHSICFDMANPYYVANIYNNALCGSLKIQTIENNTYDWILRTPDNLCTNISILQLPTNDQLLREQLELTVTYISPDKSSASYQLDISHNYEPFSIITDTSISKVTLYVLRVSTFSKILLFFQAIECNLLVTKNMALIYTIEQLQLPNTSPTIFYPLNNVSEFHVIVRIEIGYRVKISAICEVLKSLNIYDGPSILVSQIYADCDDNSFDIQSIKATTFQLYIVYVQESHKNIQMDLRYSQEFLDMDKISFFRIFDSEEIWLGWDFGNYSSIIYEYMRVSFRNLPVTHISYEIVVSPTIGPQGYMCQYGGLLMKDSRAEFPTDIGPVCSTAYGELINNVIFHTGPLTVIFYEYGLQFFQKGTFRFFLQKETCIGLINPCAICDLSYYLGLPMAALSRSVFKCLERGSVLSIMFEKECIAFYVIPNKYSKEIKTCDIIISSYAQFTLDFHITHRYILSAPHFDTKDYLKLPFKHYSYINTQKTVLEYSHKYQSLFATFTSNLIPDKSILIIVGKYVARSTCNAVWINSDTQEDGISEYEGTCLKFHVTLAKNNKHTAMNVYFSRYMTALKDYMNRFLIISWIENKDKHTLSLQNFKLFIVDQIQQEDKSLLFEFSVPQLPLIWKSFGQVLQIVIDPRQHLKESIRMTLIVLALFDPPFIMSFFKNSERANLPCHENASYVTKKSCWSVHQNFKGNWNSAAKMCQQQGGHLWSVDNEDEWTEVLTSPKYHNLITTSDHNDHTRSLRSINAIRFFRSSSVIYLGFKSHTEVRNISIFLF